VTLRATEKTTLEDTQALFGGLDAKRLIAVEEAWRERIEACALTVYEFAAEGFALLDAVAGYYVSECETRPVAKRRVTDLIHEIEGRGIAFRLLPNLWPLSDRAMVSTADYSIIRMRNAQPRPA
jgi:hypothetical protein